MTADPTDSPAAPGGQSRGTRLRQLEETLHAQWGLGERILLSWASSDEGVLVLWAPHYFLGNFTASMNDGRPEDRLEALNGSFLRKLISGPRRMTVEDIEGTARRFGFSVERIPVPDGQPLSDAEAEALEHIAKRFSISYVESRAALLLDIADFSVFTPFEQTSQLNSLSYSLNSAYSKMKSHNIAIDFARTTTGDGFYIWNRDTGPMASVNLFQFMVMVVADNAIAKRKSRGNTVPTIRTGFHMGSHYEFYQAEGVNPTLFSYIVGDLTIELARMVSSAAPGQILLGDFRTRIPTSASENAYLVEVDTERFVDRARKSFRELEGLELASEPIQQVWCFLSGETGAIGGESIRRFVITDKHNRTREVYNLMIHIQQGTVREPVLLGSPIPPGPVATTERSVSSLNRRWRT